MSFFFFQAEDGIRDHCVTGVQTCALPISGPDPRKGVPDGYAGTWTGGNSSGCPSLKPGPLPSCDAPEVVEMLLDGRGLQIGRASCRKECRSGGSARLEKRNSSVERTRTLE